MDLPQLLEGRLQAVVWRMCFNYKIFEWQLFITISNNITFYDYYFSIFFYANDNGVHQDSFGRADFIFKFPGLEGKAQYLSLWAMSHENEKEIEMEF